MIFSIVCKFAIMKLITKNYYVIIIRIYNRPKSNRITKPIVNDKYSYTTMGVPKVMSVRITFKKNR